MKEFEKLYQEMAEGLKSLSQGIEEIAKKVENLAKQKEEEPEKPEPKAPVKKVAKKRGRKPAVKKAAKKPGKKALAKKAPVKKAPPKKREKRGAATDSVFNVIMKSKNGINTAGIKAETGYNEQKIYAIVKRLKAQRKVKTKRRGVYQKP